MKNWKKDQDLNNEQVKDKVLQYNTVISIFKTTEEVEYLGKN